MNKYRCTKCRREGTVTERDCVCGGFITLVPKRYRHRCPGCRRRHTCKLYDIVGEVSNRDRLTVHYVLCPYIYPGPTMYRIGTTEELRRKQAI